MWAVYLCGCTDCFLHAMFASEEDAINWAEENSNNPEGYLINFWQTPKEIDSTDTGWHIRSCGHSVCCVNCCNKSTISSKYCACGNG